MENFLDKKYLNLSGKTWLVILVIVSFFVYAIVHHRKSNESFSSCGNRRNVPPKNLVEIPLMKKNEPVHNKPQHHVQNHPLHNVHPQHKPQHQPRHQPQPNHHIHSVPGMTLMCFYTNWCGYSKKMMGSIIPGHEYMGEWNEIKNYCNQNGVKPIAVDAEKNRDLAQKHGIRGFPTCVLLKDNTLIKTLPGFRPARNIIEEVEEGKKNPVPQETGFKRLNEKGLHLRCFYAKWCHFSKKMMGPVIPGHEFPGEWNEIENYCKSNKIDCTAVDAEDPKNEKLANSLKIDGFPTCILFKDGSPIDEMGGYMPASKLIEQLKSHN